MTTKNNVEIEAKIAVEDLGVMEARLEELGARKRENTRKRICFSITRIVGLKQRIRRFGFGIGGTCIPVGAVFG